MTETRLLIRGEQVTGDGEQLDVENPYTQETIASVQLPSDEQVDAAIAAAREAARDWGRMPAVERAELLHEVATRLRDRTDELARLMTLEGGKPLIENSDEVGWTAAAFDYYAEMGRNFAGRVIPSIESTQLALVLKEPMGVVACIVPWNYPLLLLAWKLAPALAAGNTVVCKPSELTPLSTLALADCFDHFPAGVVNLLAGAGEVGERIVSDDRVDCVAFTGSVDTGKRIAVICAERVARVNLELGGKDPFIVCEDVAEHVEVAAKGGAWAAFLNAGQVCTSAERFYVLEPVFDDFASAFVDYTNSLKLGDPLDPATDIGPLVSARQREKVAAQVDAAVEAGAQLLTGGNGAGPGKGYFYCAGGRHGRPGGDRPAPRGDLRPGRPARAGREPGRGDRARQLDPLRPRLQRVHEGSRLDLPLHARDQGRHGLVQRPADGQRRRPLRRHETVGFRARARTGRAGGVPGDEARAHGDEDRAEGVVVPLRRRRRAPQAKGA